MCDHHVNDHENEGDYDAGVFNSLTRSRIRWNSGFLEEKLVSVFGVETTKPEMKGMLVAPAAEEGTNLILYSVSIWASELDG